MRTDFIDAEEKSLKLHCLTQHHEREKEMDSRYSEDNKNTTLEKLTIESTLSDLALYNTQVPHYTPGKMISKIFKDDPITPGVILTDKKKIKGIISREFFYEVLAKRFGYAIFIRRPVYKMIQTYKYDYLVLPYDMPIREAAQMAFSIVG